MNLSTISIKQIFGAFAAFLLLAAFFNIGFIQDDEHFQILEFANYKLGSAGLTDLAWEYKAHLRAGVQPLLAYFTIGAFRALGLDNPFWQAIFLRCVAAATAGSVYWLWLRQLLGGFLNEKHQKLFLLMACGLWFVPVLLVRFSSENSSFAAFFGGLLLFVNCVANLGKSEKTKFSGIFFAGLLFGFSFYFRFQIAFGMIGLGAWLLYKRVSFSVLVTLAIGFFLAAIINTGIDFWLYDTWVFSPLCYFTVNILEHKAASFGEEAIYWYFTDTPLKAIAVLGHLLLIAFLVGCYVARSHVFTWISLAFLLGHSVVAHKETRFLFPMILCFTYLVGMGFQFIYEKYGETALFKNKISQVLFSILIAINALVLLVKCLIPANELTAYHEFVYNFVAKNPKTHLINYGNPGFYEQDSTYYLTFYQPNIGVPHLKDSLSLANYLTNNRLDTVMIVKKIDGLPLFIDNYEIKPVYHLLPDFIKQFNINNWQDRSNFWQIYLATRKK